MSLEDWQKIKVKSSKIKIKKILTSKNTDSSSTGCCSNSANSGNSNNNGDSFIKRTFDALINEWYKKTLTTTAATTTTSVDSSSNNQHYIRDIEYVSKIREENIENPNHHMDMSPCPNSTSVSLMESIVMDYRAISNIMNFLHVSDMMNLLHLNKRTFTYMISHLYSYILREKRSIRFKLGVIKDVVLDGLNDKELILVYENPMGGTFDQKTASRSSVKIFRVKSLPGYDFAEIFTRIVLRCEKIVIRTATKKTSDDNRISVKNNNSNNNVDKCPIESFKFKMTKKISDVISEIHTEKKMKRSRFKEELKILHTIPSKYFSSVCESVFVDGNDSSSSSSCSTNNVVTILSRCNPNDLIFTNFYFTYSKISYYYMVNRCTSLHLDNCTGVCNLLPRSSGFSFMLLFKECKDKALVKLLKRLKLFTNDRMIKFINFIFDVSGFQGEKIIKKIESFVSDWNGKIGTLSPGNKKSLMQLCGDVKKLNTTDAKLKDFVENWRLMFTGNREKNIDSVTLDHNYIRILVNALHCRLGENDGYVNIKSIIKMWNLSCDHMVTNSGSIGDGLQNYILPFENLTMLTLANCTGVKNHNVVCIINSCKFLKELYLEKCERLSCELFNPLFYKSVSEIISVDSSCDGDGYADGDGATTAKRVDKLHGLEILCIFDIVDFFNCIKIYIPQNIKTLLLENIHFIRNDILEEIRKLSFLNLSELKLKWCSFLKYQHVNEFIQLDKVEIFLPKVVEKCWKKSLPLNYSMVIFKSIEVLVFSLHLFHVNILGTKCRDPNFHLVNTKTHGNDDQDYYHDCCYTVEQDVKNIIFAKEKKTYNLELKQTQLKYLIQKLTVQKVNKSDLVKSYNSEIKELRGEIEKLHEKFLFPKLKKITLVSNGGESQGDFYCQNISRICRYRSIFFDKK